MGKIIQIKVIPGSRVEEVIEGEPLVVKVREPPEKGKANKAVIKLLSRHFGCRVRLIGGRASRLKLIEIEKG
jgi:hypothetical protein